MGPVVADPFAHSQSLRQRYVFIRAAEQPRFDPRPAIGRTGLGAVHNGRKLAPRRGLVRACSCKRRLGRLFVHRWRGDGGDRTRRTSGFAWRGECVCGRGSRPQEGMGPIRQAAAISPAFAHRVAHGMAWVGFSARMIPCDQRRQPKPLTVTDEQVGTSSCARTRLDRVPA